MQKHHTHLYLIFMVLALLLLIGCTLAHTNEQESDETKPEPVHTEPMQSATLVPTPEPTPAPTPEPTPAPTPEPEAEEITDCTLEMGGGTAILKRLQDGMTESMVNISGTDTLTVKSNRSIGALYLTWYDPPDGYVIQCNGKRILCGGDQMRVEYIKLDTPASEITISSETKAKLSEIRVFTTGYAPEDVQAWLPPCEQGEADVLVFPTHSDDDVIFFGTLIAQCVDRGLNVQVCYMVDHAGTEHVRSFELLNALWAMGVRHYPIIGPFIDWFVKSLGEAQIKFKENNVLAWQVEQIRRFQPLVVVGHDRQGEYGHGAHMMNALCLEKAVPLAADDTQYPESVEKWGVWDTPKLYLHYAEENPITLDAETPLKSFNGLTGFEVAQNAMQFHQSQLRYGSRPQKTDDGMRRFNCLKFGLVRTTVGTDTNNDIMEHVTTYSEKNR